MAANAGGIRAGRAYVELSTRDDKLIAGLKRAQARIRALGASIQSIGAKLVGLGVGIAAPLFAAAKAFAEVGSQLNDMAARTGASVEALSELKFAAEQTGAGLGDVETAIKRTQRAIVEAAGGSKEMADAFAAIGLDARRLAGLSVDEQFERVAKAIGGVTDPTRRAAAAIQIFGRSGTAILPMIAEMDELRAKARRLGITLSTEDAKAADELGDVLDQVTESAKRLVLAVGSALAPILTDLAEQMTQFNRQILDFAAEGRGLIVSVAKLATGLVALGVALVTLGTVLRATAVGLGLFVGALKLALTPMGAVTLALVAGAVAWLRYSDEGKKALDKIGTTAKQVFKGIADALKGGDVMLAGEVLFAGLKIAFVEGTAELRRIWSDWTFDFRTAWVAAAEAVRTSLDLLIGTMDRLKLVGLAGGAQGIAGGIAGGAAAGQAAGQAMAGRAGGVNAALNQIERERRAAQQGARADLDRARQELRDLQMRALPRAFEERKGEIGPAQQRDLQQPRRRMDDALDELERTTATKGTFAASAAALRGLGAGDEVADEVREVKQQLEQLNAKARQGRLVFVSP